MKKPTSKPLRNFRDEQADTPAAADAPGRPSFGRGQANAATRAPVDQPGFSLDELRGGNADYAAQAPRWMFSITLATMIGILLGAFYFIHVTLAFKTSIIANETSVPGPYPSFAVVFVLIPAFCGPFYFLMDYLGVRTGIHPFTTPQGIGATITIGLILFLVSFLPVSVIRHKDNAFANQHGYIRCASPFDPQRVHVYALQSYVNAYGCPTVAVPQ
jgi:hypothetical protein